MLKCVYMPEEGADIEKNLQKAEASNLQAGSRIKAPFKRRRPAIIPSLCANNSLYIHTQIGKWKQLWIASVRVCLLLPEVISKSFE